MGQFLLLLISHINFNCCHKSGLLAKQETLCYTASYMLPSLGGSIASVLDHSNAPSAATGVNVCRSWDILMLWYQWDHLMP